MHEKWVRLRNDILNNIYSEFADARPAKLLHYPTSRSDVLLEGVKRSGRSSIRTVAVRRQHH